MKKISIILFIMIATTFTGCGNNNGGKVSEQENIQIEEQNKLIEDENAKEDKKNDKKNDEKEDLAVTEVESESKKDIYLQKLDDIEVGLADLRELSGSGITLDMRKAASETYRRWDDVLNEIYSVLKVELSSSDMDVLTEKQLEWIDYRDKTAKEDSLKYKGGTIEPVVYTSTLASLTKERCYELVNLYMK